MRLDSYLAEYWPEYSRTVWQKYCQAGYVKVNGKVATSYKKHLGEDDEVTVNVPEAKIDPQTLPIIYEDDNVTVIDKPAGILTHAKGQLAQEFTVADFMRERTTLGQNTNRPGIIHRLDRDTSGVIVCAKNSETASYLQKQFSNRKVKKTYLALVEGHLKIKKGKIDIPIGRNPKKPSTFRADANGKPAITAYEVLAEDAKLSLVKLQPLTGRTHQLRVHLAHLERPVLGDRFYGKESERLFLHAYQLEITLPGGKRTTFTSELPAEFKKKFPKIAEVKLCKT